MNININLHKKKRIGYECKPYIIAEIGTNHNQDIQIARDLVNAVAESGFDCAKFQIYEAKEIVGEKVRSKDYGLDKYYGDISAFEMFDKHLKTPKEWFPELRDLCRQNDIDCAVTIHGDQGIAWARNMGFDIIKIASMDHNNLPFLRSLVNAIDAPILISFGMAKLEDIDNAVRTLSTHHSGLGIFHCVSLYPPQPEELRLANISFLQKRFAIPVGFSDHAEDVITSLAAMSLGCRLFEKHVTLNKNSMGPDHCFALEPDEMKSYVRSLRTLGNDLDLCEFVEPTAQEMSVRDSYLKSIVVAKDITAGSKLEAADLILARPGNGLQPKDLDSVIGLTVKHLLQKGTLLAWEDLDYKQ